MVIFKKDSAVVLDREGNTILKANKVFTSRRNKFSKLGESHNRGISWNCGITGSDISILRT